MEADGRSNYSATKRQSYPSKDTEKQVISGPIRPDGLCYANGAMSCFMTKSSEELTKVFELGLSDMMLQLYEHDFNEPASGEICRGWPRCGRSNINAPSQEDKMFLTIMDNECRLVDGHYQLPLPFRNAGVVMPNNRAQALHRIAGLKKRFSRDSVFQREYIAFMNDIIDKGYAIKVPSDSVNKRCDGSLWYLPYHGVCNPNKPGRVRVVFDCACQWKGASLNKELLQGPDLTSSLIGVLLRFRQESVAFVADIEAMFYHVRIPESQTDYLRFLWWPDGDTSADPEDYRMKVHLFGAVSSPSCANFALRRAADHNERQYGKSAGDALRTNLYVDDLLRSVGSVSQAVNEAASIQHMCAAGGLRLTKFVSNNRQVIETIPIADRAGYVSKVDLSRTALPVGRALGVHWFVENDTLSFKIISKDRPVTRRGILSTISTIYDPLGLASPFLLADKKLLQRLCGARLDWDDEISCEDRVLWERWRIGLPLLENIKIDRCLKPEHFRETSSYGLHHFSDASQSGYGQCSCLRSVDEEGNVYCSLIMGKSRVSPLRPITIPRLELTATTISAKVGCQLEKELSYPNMSRQVRTGSTAKSYWDIYTMTCAGFTYMLLIVCS